MPAPRKKLHQLATVVAEKTVITDTRKQRFIVEEEFAQGGFGRIYAARQEDSKEYGKSGTLVIKIEPYANGPLFTEITVFQRILTPAKLENWMDKNKINHLGLPPYVSSGLFEYKNEKMRFLIMPRYEKSLETYRLANGGVLDLHVVLTVAKQCADCLSYMQDHDYVHADLKADNILLASANTFSKCFLVDFGLAKKAKGNIDKPDKKKAHNGTLQFTSLDAHRGYAPSFRGDLEILCYNILYWLCGNLPWQKCAGKSEAVMEEKEKFSKDLSKSIKKLVQYGCVPQLTKLFQLAYETPYLNKVDYEAVRSILDQIEISISPSKRRKTKSAEKENSESPRTRNSLSTSRKRKIEVTNFVVKLVDEKLVQGSKDKLAADRSESIDKSSPELKKRRSCAQVEKKSIDISNGEQSPKISDNTGNRGSEKAAKKSLTEKTAKLRTGLRSVATNDTPIAAEKPSSSERTSVDESPGKKLRNIIPGVRNMKNVRRSLKETLVKKYVGVADQE